MSQQRAVDLGVEQVLHVLPKVLYFRSLFRKQSRKSAQMPIVAVESFLDDPVGRRSSSKRPAEHGSPVSINAHSGSQDTSTDTVGFRASWCAAVVSVPRAFKLPNSNSLTSSQSKSPPQTPTLLPPPPEKPPTAEEYPCTDFEPTQSSPVPSPPQSPPL